MQLDELVQTHQCPICIDFPRPYLPVENCVNMHMVCGPCYAQMSKKRKKQCPQCQLPFKKYPHIPGYHRPLEIAQQQYSYECRNKLLGCTKRLNYFNVEEHDKLCLFMPYRCSKPNCSFICAFADIAKIPHPHLKIIVSRGDCIWGFRCRLNQFYSRMLNRILIDSNVPKFALIRGTLENFDFLFKPIVSFYPSPSGKAVKTKITWHCKRVFSLVNLDEYKFLVTFYLSTHAGYIRRSFITRAQYISFCSSTKNEIKQDFFVSLINAFKISTCIECYCRSPHFHIKILLLDPNILTVSN